jgi:predicted metal-dependent HD superfamily phosphohydrolase
MAVPPSEVRRRGEGRLANLPKTYFSMELKAEFCRIVEQYGGAHLQSNLWNDLHSAYTDSSRHYHNLTHLENLYTQLLPVKNNIENWDAVLFALFYHDAVYNTLKHNNEEKSAELAQEHMQLIRVPPATIDRTVAHILATKAHVISEDNDTNLFTDADLSILGAPSDAYIQYTEQIRKEYRFYPDLVYKPGRRKVLQHFLGMERIYKTEYFFARYEEQARRNIAAELQRL